MDDLRKRQPAGKKVHKSKARPESAAKTPATNWSVAEAKAKLSEVIERARAGEPQMITRHGRNVVVIVDAQQWQEISLLKSPQRHGTLYEVLRSSPMAGVKLDLKRPKGGVRDIDFGS